jgi:anaerobic dimethyl sulfoxide reductase subunit A
LGGDSLTAGPGGTPVACNRDCGATCSVVARRNGSTGELRLASNPLNPRWKTPCPRGLRALESQHAPDRLLHPLIRTGRRGSGEFREASWEEALSRVTESLTRIVDQYGAGAIVNGGGSGGCKGAVHHTSRLTSRFLNLLGPVTRMVGNYSFQAAAFVLPYHFGSFSAGWDVQTIRDTRFVILWGANPSVTRFGNETEEVLRHIREAGGEIIVVDPRRSRSAHTLGTEWIGIRPGTDSAAMLALTSVLLEEDRADRGFLSRYVSGFDELERYISGAHDGVPKTPEWAAPICGIPSATLRDLARRYAAARPAVLIPGFSVQRTVGGEEAYRMSVVLQAVTGNTGRPGGSPGTSPWFGLPGPRIPVLDGGVHTGAEISKLTWPRALLGGSAEGYAADIRAAYFCGANYLNQGSDVAANVRALESLEFVVCHEMFLTPTARYADVVLPASHPLEREDVIIPEDNFLYYSAKVLDHPGDARDDFDIYAALAALMGREAEFTGGLSSEQWVNRLIDESDVTPQGRDEFKRTGIYDPGDHERYGLAEFIADPEAHPLDTPSGRIEFSSVAYGRTGVSPYPSWRGVLPQSGDGETPYPLMMVTPHSRFRINSTGSNIDWVRRAEPLVLDIHPDDAAARKVANGDMVLVKSESGQLQVAARVTDGILPGVISLFQGGWFGTADGPSANEVTSLEPTQPSGGTRTHTVFVEVEKQSAGP